MSLRRGMPWAKLEPNADGSLVFTSSYDATLVSMIKSQVPYTGRKWDRDEKAWVIDPKYAQTVADIVLTTLGKRIAVPQMLLPPEPVILAKQLEYLGVPKDRNGEVLASGYCDGTWSLIFSLEVLREWFEPGEVTLRPSEAVTYYSVLGVSKTATEEEIKKAYRRAARTYHPDVNYEPDAADQFKRINEAYQVLSDPIKHQRYRVGLTMSQGVAVEQPRFVWRPPLRCGWLLIQGIHQIDRFIVSKILGWEDIVNAEGKTMVSYWPAGGKQFETRWV